MQVYCKTVLIACSHFPSVWQIHNTYITVNVMAVSGSCLNNNNNNNHLFQEQRRTAEHYSGNLNKYSGCSPDAFLMVQTSKPVEGHDVRSN